VCYCLGGSVPTVTDANVVLGYINPHSLACGAVPLDKEQAYAVIRDKVAGPLGQDLEEAAWGVHLVSNATMARAIKAVSTYRGRDPRDFVLFAFGGNGGVHASQLARGLGIRQVVVPPAAGVLSALGLLFANTESSRSRAFISRTRDIVLEDMIGLFGEIEQEILSELGLTWEQVKFTRFADVRYGGQAYELSILVNEGQVTQDTVHQLEEAFEAEHERTYGHHFPGQAKELVSLRVVGSKRTTGEEDLRCSKGGLTLSGHRNLQRNSRRVYLGPQVGRLPTTVYNDRKALSQEPLPGPMIIEEYEGTVVVDHESQVKLDHWGNIVIELDASKE
jgi:N-methylhydantoinase A